MLKNISRLEHKVGERVFHFLCDMDAPLHEVKEALFEFLKYVGKVEDLVREQVEKLDAEKKESEAKEQPKVVEMPELEHSHSE